MFSDSNRPNFINLDGVPCCGKEKGKVPRRIQINKTVNEEHLGRGALSCKICKNI